MFKDVTKLVLYAKATADVLKETIETKVTDLALQLKRFKDKSPHTESNNGNKCNLKEKAKEELMHLLSQINHKAQINELNVKGFIKDKLTELTNNALLDSMELNDIRAEIAALRAEIADLKSQVKR